MLVTLTCVPIFFVFGIIFGLISWLFAAWIVCGSKDWTEKWQSFSRTSIKMSNDHNILVAYGADFVETFECIKPCRMIGKNMLIQYYKIGHSLSIYIVLFLFSLSKALLLFPIWSSICCRETYNQQLQELLSKKKKKSKEATSSTSINVGNRDDDNEQDTNNNNE
eukprot:UN02588